MHSWLKRVVAAAAILVCLPGSVRAQGDAGPAGPAPPAGPRRAPGAQVDQPVEDFSLRDLMADPKAESTPVRLSDYRGKKHVVLFFFSEKCGHTKKYAKRVTTFVKQNVGEEVAFLGLRSNADDTPESIRGFARGLKFDFPVLDDPEGRVARYFRVLVAPTFVVIDREGVMRYFGSFDNDMGHGTAPGASEPLLANALRAVRADEPVPVKRAIPFG